MDDVKKENQVILNTICGISIPLLIVVSVILYNVCMVSIERADRYVVGLQNTITVLHETLSDLRRVEITDGITLEIIGKEFIITNGEEEKRVKTIDEVVFELEKINNK